MVTEKAKIKIRKTEPNETALVNKVMEQIDGLNITLASRYEILNVEGSADSIERLKAFVEGLQVIRPWVYWTEEEFKKDLKKVQDE